MLVLSKRARQERACVHRAVALGMSRDPMSHTDGLPVAAPLHRTNAAGRDSVPEIRTPAPSDRQYKGDPTMRAQQFFSPTITIRTSLPRAAREKMTMAVRGQEQTELDSKSNSDDSTIQNGQEDDEKAAQPAVQASSSHLSGIKLFLVMTGVTLVMFLAMLDIAIISTVCPPVTQS